MRNLDELRGRNTGRHIDVFIVRVWICGMQLASGSFSDMRGSEIQSCQAKADWGKGT